MLSSNLSRPAAVLWFSLKEVGLGQRKTSTHECILDHLLEGRENEGEIQKEGE